ncbi:MAG TPA: sulfotransferase [Trebonia sp.]|nr:sulfotransferase [Trebonia sp.]
MTTDDAGACAAPVFVLCAARSGSTLLRFVLDAHPDLACPPETNVPALCGQLATVWSLIEGAPLSQERGDEPPDIPDAAIAGVRETMDRMTGSYLARRGKKRYCDKSLGTARFTYLMTRIWPEAKFICLFRHPMDVIASGMEACPWGLNGYGFDPYIAETPGNAVFALARFWADNAAVIAMAEEQYADRCLRVRYEDMVAGPQTAADRIFEFLAAAPVPDIEDRMFAAERERYGPADYKIWHTSRISGDSVGRGWTTPAGLIGPQVRESINELCGKLGYLPVDDDWGAAEPPADLRVPVAASGPAAAGSAETAEASGTTDGRRATSGAPDASPLPVPDLEFAAALRERLTVGITGLSDGFAGRWEPCAKDMFEVVATPPSGNGRNAHWLVDLGTRTVTARGGAHLDVHQDAEDEEPDSDWDVIASADTWNEVISGKLNVSVALRRHLFRYRESAEAGPIAADARIGMLADLLGLASWGQARQRVSPGDQSQADHGDTDHGPAEHGRAEHGRADHATTGA